MGRAIMTHGWSRPWSFAAKNLLLDGLVSAIATPLARWLADPSSGIFHPLWFIVGGGITLCICGVIVRMPQQYWRYSSVLDLRTITMAALLSAASFALLLWVTGFGLPTATFPAIHALLLIVALGGVRVIVRLRATRRHQQRDKISEDVLLLGSEERLDLLIRLLRSGSSQHYTITGLVSSQRAFKGQRIHGYSILGESADIASILASLSRQGRRPTHLIIADPALEGAALMALLTAIDDDIRVVRMPALETVQPTAKTLLQPISVDDLLNRFPRTLTQHSQAEMASLIEGKNVLVTGAGGSIGGELVRQIADFSPASILLLDNNEYALWSISLDLSERYPDLRQHQILADIQKRSSLERIFDEFCPQLIFHAAALKHVPLVEESPCEGILTNSIGTRYLAECARDYGAEALVFISTDKAVYPSSVMGASKRCAEMYVQRLDRQARAGRGGLRCVSVRFGNVLGSTGSVVPLFQRQLARGGPLTVTHPDMTRYFMTIPEAVGLVLQAAQRGTTQNRSEGDESELEQRLRSGSIFVLDMGEPVRIMDLARQMIRLAGLRPERDIAIRITGVREGEKLTETLFYKGESPLKTDTEGLWIVTPEVPEDEAFMVLLDRLEQACHDGNIRQALALLEEAVPDFVSKRPLGAEEAPL